MMAALFMKGFVLTLFGQSPLKKSFYYGGSYEFPDIRRRLTCKKCGSGVARSRGRWLLRILSGLFVTTRRTSAFGGKVEVNHPLGKSPLIAKSGHS